MLFVFFWYFWPRICPKEGATENIVRTLVRFRVVSSVGGREGSKMAQIRDGISSGSSSSASRFPGKLPFFRLKVPVFGSKAKENLQLASWRHAQNGKSSARNAKKTCSPDTIFEGLNH